MRDSPDTVTLYYSSQAAADAKEGIVRPAIHALTSSTAVLWQVSEQGAAIVGPKVFAKTIVRMLQGAGSTYAVPMTTWNYYKENRMLPMNIFRVLRNFEANPGFNVSVEIIVL